MRRLLTIFTAFAVGWIVYMIAMVMTVYDGFLSLIFQPFMAAFCSAVSVSGSFILGLIFKIPTLGRIWRATPIPAVMIVLGSLVILCFGSRMGLKETFTDPETNRQFEGLRSDAALSGYFALIFAITNWPTKRHSSES